MKGRGKQSQGAQASGAMPQQGQGSAVAANAGNLLTAAIKPSVFSGEQASWKDFEFSLLNYITTIDAYLSELMMAAAASTAPVPLPQDGNDLVRTRWLFALIGGLTRGSARRLVQNSGSALQGRNGLELWRAMVAEYEPRTSSRRLGLLLSILSPNFGEEQEEQTWKSNFDLWETTILEYESLSGRTFDTEVKSAVLLMNVPKELKVHVQLKSEEYLTNYQALSTAVKGWIQSRRNYQVNSGSDAMDVDRIGSGKGRPSSSSNGNQKKIECFNCGGNHFARNCPQKSHGSGASSSGASGKSWSYPSSSSSSSSVSSAGGKGGKGGKGGGGKDGGKGKGGKDSKGGKGKSKGGKSKGGKNVRAVEEEWQENTWEGTYETVWEEEPWQQNEEEVAQEVPVESFGHHETAEEGDENDLWIY
jgi:hypothetical protein